MANPFDQFDAPKSNPFDQFDAPPKASGAIRRLVADKALGFASGAVGATKAIADAAGAGNAVSTAMEQANAGINDYLSPEAKADQQEQAAIMAGATGKGAWEGIKAGALAFGVAPVQTAMQGLGSVAPIVAGSALTGGALPAAAVGAGLGVAMGAGTAKGAIFDDIKKRSLAAGMTDADATAAATRAQEYGGENTDQIALGGALGAADALTGVSAVAGKLARGALGKPVAAGIAEGSRRGVVGRALTGMAGEMPLEAAQGGQEQLAANLAAQRAGFDAGTFDNVASNATLEALASAGPGAAFGVANRAPAQSEAPPATPALQIGNTPEPAPPAGPTPQLGYSPLAGTPTVFPDGSVALNGEQEFARRYAPQKPSEAMGLDPAAGPLSAAAVTAVDTGAHQEIQLQQASEADQAAYQQATAEQDRQAAEMDTATKPITHGPIAEAAMSPEDKRAVLFSNQTVADGGIQYKGTLDGDILNGLGKPYPNRLAAARRANMEGKDWTIAQVQDGFVARRKDANGQTTDVLPVPAGSRGRRMSEPGVGVAPVLGAGSAVGTAVDAGSAGDRLVGTAAPSGDRGNTAPIATTRAQPTALGTQTTATAGPGFTAKDVTRVQNAAPGTNTATAAPAVEAPAVVAGDAATAEGLPAAGSSTVEGAGVDHELVKIKTFQGINTFVRKKDLEGDSTHLRMFTSTGKNNGRIHRENLDPTGEKQAADNASNADNPLFDVVARKNGASFSNRLAARRAMAVQGLAESHEIVPAADVSTNTPGFVIRRKQPKADEAETSQPQEQPSEKAPKAIEATAKQQAAGPATNPAQPAASDGVAAASEAKPAAAPVAKPGLERIRAAREAKKVKPNALQQKVEQARMARALPEVKIEDVGEKIGGARKDTAVSTGPKKERASVEDDARPTWAKRFQINQVAKGFDMSVNGRDITGKWTISDLRTKDRFGQPQQLGRYFDTREDAESALPLLAVSQKHRVLSGAKAEDGTYKQEIWRDINDRKRVKVVDQEFATREEAMRYMAQHAQEILDTNTTFGEADIPKPESTQRKGVERRTGDVKGEDFRGAFGMRAVEFGNWNNQDERQEVMNAAYDGLMDLAEVLGVPPKAIGLNGDLALAFGARGHGLSSARAHYERDRVVMNLTKINGAGALAHEWFHALDHYLARQDGKTTAEWKINKDGTRSLDVHGGESDMASGGFRSVNSGVREELRSAYTSLVQSLFTKAEQYVEDTARADKFVAVARGELERELGTLRDDLSKHLDARYYKRNNKPASAEQLAEFDTLSAELVEGRGLSTEWKHFPGKTRLAIQSRHTNETLEKLNEIYKAVRGRSGFNAERRGVIDSLTGYMKRYDQRMQMLREANALTTKTKRVPTSFAMDAKSLDQGRGGDYWTSPPEMVARAFQGYVEDAIAAKDGKSPFLNYAPENVAILTPWGAKRPFPSGDERKAMNSEFDKFIGVIQTKETDQGVAMFSRAEGYNDAVDSAIAAAARGERPGRGPVSIGTTTPALHAAGIQNGELTTSPTIIAKSMFDHGVTKTLLKAIPDLLENPVMVLDSDTVAGSFVVVTSEFVNGKPLMVVVSPEETRGHVTFNFVPSVYPKDDFSAIQRWVNGGKLRYIDKKQSPSWFGSTRLQLPGEYRTLKGLQARNIASEADIVKSLSKNSGNQLGEPSTGITQEQFTAELTKAFGPKVAERLQAQGIVVPVTDKSKIPGSVSPFLRDGDKVYGFYDPSTNRTYAVLENLTPDMVKGVVLHEVGVHFGFEGLLGIEKYAQVMKRVNVMRLAGNKAVLAAYAEAKQNAAHASQVGEETIAYLVQRNQDMGLVREIIARIKAFLYEKFGIGGDSLTEADLTMLARAAVLHATRTGEGKGLAPAFVRGTTEPVTKSNDVVGNQGGRSADDTTPGVLKDESGNPLVVYHGSPQTFDKFEAKHISSGMYGEGFYFTNLRDDAELYAEGGRVIKANLVMKNPASRAVAEEVANRVGEDDYTAIRKELQNMGYDGVIAKGTAGGEVIYVVFKPEQITQNESTAPDSGGAPVAQTDTPAFKAWFGDSKVVDADGKPLVVYHGTNKTEQGDAFTMFDSYGSNYGLFGQGAYFTENPAVASSYTSKGRGDAPSVYPAFLSIKNPMDMDKPIRQKELDAWRKAFPDVDFGNTSYEPPMGKRPNGLNNEDFYRIVEEHLTDEQVERYEGAQIMQEGLRSMGHDGITHVGGGRVKSEGVRHQVYIAFDPEQVKSATGNNGQFDASNPDIRFSRSIGDTLNTAANNATVNKVVDKLNEHFTHPGKVSWWDKTVGSPYHLAERSHAFKRVFEAVQRFINDVSFYANEAADLAPKLLPKLDTWRDLGKQPISAADNTAIAAPIYEGTLSWTRDEAGKPVRVADDETAGIVFTDAELKSLFNLTPEQIGLYHQFRDATDKSLDNMAKAEMLRYGGKDVVGLRDMVMDAQDANDAAVLLRDHLIELAKDDEARAGALTETAHGMIERSDKVDKLKKKGYAPLSRFGRYSVDVVVAGKREYFGLFETVHDSNKMAAKMKMMHGAANVAQGTMSQKQFQLFQGITPESLELFGNMLGLESDGDKASDKAFQDYLRLTKNNRSAMKRLIHRKGIAGYSEDVGRTLAAFVYSNARQTAAGLHMGEMGEAVNDIPKVEGELKDAAIELTEYVKNPREEAQALRGLMFAQYLGGSVASAFVNFTQPMTVSFPYLSQFGGAGKAGAALIQAMKDQRAGKVLEPGLARALKIADETGTTQPQAVHELMAQSRGAATLKAGDGTRMGDASALVGNSVAKVALGWGKLFGLAEQINRRSTFIAAYRMAKDKGIANPAAFATKAVNETQFINNKGNKAKFGRGAIGATLMAFKSYSINYLELLHRMATRNGPEGKKAAALMLGMLFLMAGAGGMPGADDLDDVIDLFAQRLGYNFSSQKAKQEFLEGLFGKAGAQFIERGITGLPGAPIDVSGRMSMGNLIPGTGLLLKKSDHTRDVTEVAGAFGDMAIRAFKAGDQLLSGDLGKAILTASPKAASNFAQGVDMASSGMYKDAKGYKVIDTTPTEAAMKAIGFQPASVSKVQEANYLNQRAKDFYSLHAADIRSRWAKGIFEDDKDQVQAARDMMKTWNDNNPDQRIMPNMVAIMRKVHEMRKTKEQRIADTAPKAMRATLRQQIAERAAQ